MNHHRPRGGHGPPSSGRPPFGCTGCVSPLASLAPVNALQVYCCRWLLPSSRRVAPGRVDPILSPGSGGLTRAERLTAALWHPCGFHAAPSATPKGGASKSGKRPCRAAHALICGSLANVLHHLLRGTSVGGHPAWHCCSPLILAKELGQFIARQFRCLLPLLHPARGSLALPSPGRRVSGVAPSPFGEAALAGPMVPPCSCSAGLVRL